MALFPFLLVALFVVGVVPGEVLALFKGAASVGNVPPAMVTGKQFPTLLIAVAYAGSGGTLLLAQSLWLRDKGFGMAAYQGRIAGILSVSLFQKSRAFAGILSRKVAEVGGINMQPVAALRLITGH